VTCSIHGLEQLEEQDDDHDVAGSRHEIGDGRVAAEALAREEREREREREPVTMSSA